MDSNVLTINPDVASYIAYLEFRLAQADRVVAFANEHAPEIFEAPEFEDFRESERRVYN